MKLFWFRQLATSAMLACLAGLCHAAEVDVAEPGKACKHGAKFYVAYEWGNRNFSKLLICASQSSHKTAAGLKAIEQVLQKSVESGGEVVILSIIPLDD